MAGSLENAQRCSSAWWTARTSASSSAGRAENPHFSRSSLLLAPRNFLGIQLSHPAGAVEQIRLAWLATLSATLDGEP
jgi:hypothetical protein